MTPLSEFIWADFLRRRMRRQLVECDFESAVDEALRLVRSREAAGLPGWCGPDAAMIARRHSSRKSNTQSVDRSARILTAP